jgi:hypothetical protein
MVKRCDACDFLNQKTVVRLNDTRFGNEPYDTAGFRHVFLVTLSIVVYYETEWTIVNIPNHGTVSVTNAIQID